MAHALLRGQKKKYEAKQFTLNTGTTDYDVRTTAGMFGTVGEANFIEIRTTENISAKLNSTSNDSIQIKSTDSPYSFDPTNSSMLINNIYLSNSSGSNSTVDIFIA